MKYYHYVFQDWEKVLVNENSPKHTGGAIMLDAVGYYDEVMGNDPEKILGFSNWMGISLDRLKILLLDQVRPQK